MINILIASRFDEDQKNILAVLANQKDFHIIDIVKDEAGSIIKSEHLKPDIIILDLQLTNENGLELVRIIRRRSSFTKIIILFDNNENINFNYASLAIIAGTSGFLLKESDINKLTHIINIIYLGGHYINESIITKLVKENTSINHPNHIESILLSPVERNIIRLLAQGLTDSQIAGELNLCKGTIRNYMTKIRHKTKLKSRLEIVIYSLISGFIHIERYTNKDNYEI
ncbi:MAG: response regulator transcription factor [Treponema sp.]|nr:response regulator transcription factor [Treponema sp.]